MRTWIVWIMNGNSFILLWLFNQVNPQLSLPPSCSSPCSLSLSLLRALVFFPPPPPNTYTLLSLVLFPRGTAPAEPISESFLMSCWIWKWRKKTMSSAGCVVWIFMREPARKLNRSYEGARQRGWQLTRAHSAAHPWLPAASQQSGGCVSDRAAASSLLGQHKTRSCSCFSASFLFLPPPADQFELWK